MAEVRIGSYAKYKGKYGVVVDWDQFTVKLLDVYDSKKINVLWRNVEVAPWVCHQTTYRDVDYLVTIRDNFIVSLDTNKVMRWGPDHGLRVGILNKIGVVSNG
jgi:hypothetical protein